MVRSSDGNTDFLDIVIVVLLGDTFARYFFILLLDYVVWTSIDIIKEKGFTLKIKKQMIT